MTITPAQVVVATTKVHIFKQITTLVQDTRRQRTVVVATTKVHIFKQITTALGYELTPLALLLLPQRYIFSSKSQLNSQKDATLKGCCCYHKGTYFQANHNKGGDVLMLTFVVVATTKVHIFKQITTQLVRNAVMPSLLLLPQRYIFSSKSQHAYKLYLIVVVVVATTKVHIFKQITTGLRYQLYIYSCCCYHKGTYFQANHNSEKYSKVCAFVVVATTKVHIFKQITTYTSDQNNEAQLLLLPQRYIFSSKSQLEC